MVLACAFVSAIPFALSLFSDLPGGSDQFRRPGAAGPGARAEAGAAAEPSARHC